MVPFFLTLGSRQLFCLFYPSQQPVIKGYILHIPAFAEEMNKARRMVALQARQFTNQGYAVLVLDLFGTGDSSGDLSETSWVIWQEDVIAACAWLQQQGATAIILWGLRLGTLLALSIASSSPIPIAQVLCWQPVWQGELFIMQFLRLRVAAAMLSKNTAPEKTSDLKQQLLAGQTVEVAGYTLAPALVNPLLALSAIDLPLTHLASVHIVEIVNSEEVSLTANSQKFIAKCQAAGTTITSATVVGNPFWATQEIVEVPGLLVASANCLV
jgi:exosortase A-associated hydrolase 2